jgi:nucleoside-triphosphatase
VEQALLLSGAPGTGKTSLIREAVAGMAGKVGGFYTQEIRIGGVRQGFEIITLDGTRAILAHINIRSSRHVGKYGVDIEALDRVGVQSVHHALEGQAIVVVDEIGKMELFSAAFREAVMETLESGHRLLGTIMQKAHPWADAIKADPRVKVLSVTRTNHRQVLEDISRWLQYVHSL